LFNQLKKYQVGSCFRTYEVNGETVSVDVFDHLYDDDKGCSWNEVSGRYTQTSDKFYLPKKLRSNPSHGNKQSSGEYINPHHPYEDGYEGNESEILDSMREVYIWNLKYYNKLLKNGVAKELARILLPQGIYSEAYWTVSLQSIIHFLKQRTGPDSQLEIQKLAQGILKLVKPDLDKIGVEL
jgi:thymidylate synthase (FAD)